MNELQKVESRLLSAFDDVCKQLGIEYFLVCGSALGAVKYGGFIPWDDDIDVALFREDYDLFVREAPALLEDWVFLQNYRTDPRFPQIYSKLRDSRTTYIEKTAQFLPINHGVFIDVFPLDGYPETKRRQRMFELKKRFYQSMLLSAFESPRSGASLVLYKIWRLLGVPSRTAEIALKYEKMVSSYSVEYTDVICNHGNWQGPLEYAPAIQYGKGAWMDFEGLRVKVPELYDEYLSQKYGDWRADLPLEEQVGHHYCIICDITKSFECYF